METLHLTLRSGIGALQAALRLPEPVEQRDLVFGGCVLREDVYLTHFHAGQFPLGDRHLFDIELLGPALRLPFGFQIITELIEFNAAFAGQDYGAGAKAVSKGVQADGGLSLGSFGAGRL